MTRTLKHIAISILTTAVLLCAGLLLLPGAVRANAEGEDANFNITPGAYTHYGNMYDLEGEDRWIMGFGLNKISSAHEDLKLEPDSFWAWNETPYYKYTATLYRTAGDEDVKLFSVSVKYTGSADDKYANIELTRQKHTYYTEEIYFAGEDFAGIELAPGFAYVQMEDGSLAESVIKSFERDSYSGKLNLPLSTAGDTIIGIQPNDPFTEYFVEFSYEFLTYTNGGITGKKQVTSGSCKSSERSLYSTFYNMEQAGMLEQEIKPAFGDEAYNIAYNILHNTVQRTVSIQYLQQIPGTPFAEKVTQSAEVTMQQDSVELPIDAAAAALGLSSFDCLQSYCSGFKSGTGANTYVADYFNSIWLKARTVDGNDYNYYLNINESYAEFYQHFVDAGIFDQGAYETVYSSQIYANYEELEGYAPEEVYGYFGFAMIPKTYGINTLWTEFFNTETSKSGVISTFEYGVDLTLAAYNELLKDYNYSFLRRIWNDTANLFTGGSEDTTCYILYAEPGTKSSFVAENGGDDINDDTGAAGQPIEDVGDFVGGVIDAVGDGLGAIGDFIAGLSSGAKAISTIVIIALAVIVIIILTRNSGKSKN